MHLRGTHRENEISRQFSSSAKLTWSKLILCPPDRLAKRCFRMNSTFQQLDLASPSLSLFKSAALRFLVVGIQMASSTLQLPSSPISLQRGARYSSTCHNYLTWSNDSCTWQACRRSGTRLLPCGCVDTDCFVRSSSTSWKHTFLLLGS
jgi:hypothetical protein